MHDDRLFIFVFAQDMFQSFEDAANLVDSEHGKNIARVWQTHGKHIAITWQEHGKNMARAWQPHGKNMANTREKQGKRIAKALQSYSSHMAGAISMGLVEFIRDSMGQLECGWMQMNQFGLGHTVVHLLGFDVETGCVWVTCRLLRFAVRSQSFWAQDMLH